MYDHHSSPEYARVQPHILDSLDRYANNYIPPGDFLLACLSNDFMGAATRADCRNRIVLMEIAKYIYNELPSACHGSPERVHDWLKRAETERYNDRT